MKRIISTRALGALGVTAVLLLTGACSSGSDDDEKDETTEETTTTVAEVVEMSDEDFAAGLAEFSTALEASGGDLCAMLQAQELVPQASPANEQQMEQTMDVYTDMLRAFATAVADDPETSATLNATADELERTAREAGYPKDFLNPADPADTPAAMTTPEYQAAGAALSERFSQQCPQPGAMTDPGATEGGAGDDTTTEPSTTLAP